MGQRKKPKGSSPCGVRPWARKRGENPFVFVTSSHLVLLACKVIFTHKTLKETPRIFFFSLPSSWPIVNHHLTTIIHHCSSLGNCLRSLRIFPLQHTWIWKVDSYTFWFTKIRVSCIYIYIYTIPIYIYRCVCIFICCWFVYSIV